MICYYSLAGINYKNNVVTCCPRQSDFLAVQDSQNLPSKFINNENFIDLRKKLINDVWPDGCDTCQKIENKNIPSMRQDYILENDVFYDNKNQIKKLAEFSEKKIIECLNDDYTISFDGIRHVELRFSDSCNLNCLHCSEVFSSRWKKILKNLNYDEGDNFHNITQLLGTEHRKKDEKYSINVKIEDIEKIVYDLCKNFKNIERIDFSGGEPLFQKQFWIFLEKIQRHQNIDNIQFSFHTNLNCDYDVDLLNDLLKNFGGCTIIISVDGGKNSYEFFRNGSNWNKLVDNICKLKKLNFRVQKYITCTTSAFQIIDLENIFMSFMDLNLKMECSFVQSPAYLDPCVLKHDFYDQIVEDIIRTFSIIKNHKNFRRRDEAVFNLEKIRNYFCNNNIEYRYYYAFLHYIKRVVEIFDKDFNSHYEKFKFFNGELIRG